MKSIITVTVIVTITVIITIMVAAHTYRTLYYWLSSLVWELICCVSARGLVEAMVVAEWLEMKL